MNDVDTLVPFLAEDDLGDAVEIDEDIVRKHVGGNDADDDVDADLIDPEELDTDEEDEDFEEEM